MEATAAAQTQQSDQWLCTFNFDAVFTPPAPSLEVPSSYHQDKIRELLITQNYLGFLPFIIKHRHVGDTGL